MAFLSAFRKLSVLSSTHESGIWNISRRFSEAIAWLAAALGLLRTKHEGLPQAYAPIGRQLTYCSTQLTAKDGLRRMETKKTRRTLIGVECDAYAA